MFLLITAFFALGKYAQYKESQLPPEVRQAREQARTEQRARDRAASEQRRIQNEQWEARLAQQKEDERCANSAMAFVSSQEYVRARLRAPSTAKFPGSRYPNIRIQHIGDCKHQVFAYVDSQNGLGAMIRTQYYAEIQYIRNSGNKWRLLDLKIN